jgi:hypothetical protein
MRRRRRGRRQTAERAPAAPARHCSTQERQAARRRSAVEAQAMPSNWRRTAALPRPPGQRHRAAGDRAAPWTVLGGATTGSRASARRHRRRAPIRAHNEAIRRSASAVAEAAPPQHQGERQRWQAVKPGGSGIRRRREVCPRSATSRPAAGRASDGAIRAALGHAHGEGIHVEEPTATSHGNSTIADAGAARNQLTRPSRFTSESRWAPSGRGQSRVVLAPGRNMPTHLVGTVPDASSSNSHKTTKTRGDIQSGHHPGHRCLEILNEQSTPTKALAAAKLASAMVKREAGLAWDDILAPRDPGPDAQVPAAARAIGSGPFGYPPRPRTLAARAVSSKVLLSPRTPLEIKRKLARPGSARAGRPRSTPSGKPRDLAVSCTRASVVRLEIDRAVRHRRTGLYSPATHSSTTRSAACSAVTSAVAAPGPDPPAPRRAGPVR